MFTSYSIIIDKTSTGKYSWSLGEVEVKAADRSTLTGTLSIPAVIYIKIGTTIYGYNVVKISDKAFQNQTGRCFVREWWILCFRQRIAPGAQEDSFGRSRA